MLNPPQTRTQEPANRKKRRAARRQRRKNDGNVSLAGPNTVLGPAQKKLLNQALEHQNAGRLGEAENCYRQTLSEDPDCAPAHFGLGLITSRARNFDAAYGHYKRAVTLDPENVAYWKGLGQCLSNVGQHQAAVIAYDNAIARKQDDVGLLTQAAWAFHRNDMFTKALETYDRALAIDPRYVPALIGKGQQYFSLGDFPAARACFTRALKIDPDYPEAFFRLVDMTHEPAEMNDLVKRIEQVIASHKNDEKIARLHFAAGKGYQRLKEYDEAFERFATGNAIIRRQVDFDRDKIRRTVDETIEAFRPEIFEPLADAASETALPVFIVGMPRSGSTLVEQIISSHPDVADAGEFPKLTYIAQLLSTDRGGLRYPRDMARFEAGPLEELGADYLNALRRGRSETALRITDKLLNNFLYVGLIHILFPEAAIIHCRRNPMDSCLSCYTQMFAAASDLAYTNDLADLGFYYCQYERLMAHWREVLPGRMFEVQYEKMVENQEEMSHKLIEHIGLPWDDACLEFYNAQRSVRTASHSQVRKPIYTSSVEGWRKYEKHLSPLKEALEQFAPEGRNVEATPGIEPG